VREVRRTPNGAGALAMIWRYVFMVNDRMRDVELVPLLIAAAGEEEKEEIVNVADQLIERGRQEGARRKACEMLLKQLRIRFGVLPETVVARVSSAETAQIDLWVERVLTAPSLAEVLGEA
jgi:hypothetical protein